jgi:hypothetical protein
MPRKISPLAERALGLRGVGNNSSSVTAGKRMFVDFGDARSAWAKRWADLITAHASDLGGPEVLSEAQLSICRRAAAIECELEGLEGRMLASQPIDIGVYARLTGVLCRLLELVGIRRLTKPVDPTSALARARHQTSQPSVRASSDTKSRDQRTRIGTPASMQQP